MTETNLWPPSPENGKCPTNKGSAAVLPRGGASHLRRTYSLRPWHSKDFLLNSTLYYVNVILTDHTGIRGATPRYACWYHAAVQALSKETGKDRKRENLPQKYEVAVLIPNEWAEPCFRGVVVEERVGGSYDQRLKCISDQSPHYMPLHYVLLFPMGYGGHRWSDRLWNSDGTPSGKINHFPYARRPFQQYCIDVYAIIDQQDLEWIRSNQTNLRREVLHGLIDHLEINGADPHMVGQKVILPSSYHAGDRAMQQAFQNAYILRRVYGATSLFIIFTANSKWPEVVDCMHSHSDAMNRPDIVARVFHMKQRQLLEEIRGKGNRAGCFGRCIAFT